MVGPLPSMLDPMARVRKSPWTLRLAAVGFLLALFLLGAGLIGTALNGALWEVAARLILLILILLPASRAFVWRDRKAEPGPAAPSA